LRESSNNEKFLMALIDKNEKVTQIWYNSKAVIPEIKYYGKELLGAKYQESQHVYGPTGPKPFPDTTTFTSGMGCINKASAQGDGFVMTRLTKGNFNYMAIVSHDPFNTQNIELTVANGYNWSEIGPARNLDEASAGDANPDFPSGMNIRRTLGPGGIILIRYTAI